MGDDPILHAFFHFYHMDKANASIHLASVRFSPITFALANTASCYYTAVEEVNEVLEHVGTYALDTGR